MGIFDLLKGGRPEDRFARHVMALLERKGWPHPMAYHPETFSIATTPDGDYLNLANLHRSWLNARRGEREAVLSSALSGLVEQAPAPNFETAVPALLPIVRNRTHLALCFLEGGKALPEKPIAGALGAQVAVDWPNAIEFVTPEALDQWEIGFEAALARAIANLRARPSVPFHDMGGFHMSDFGDRYDASRLLLPEVFEALPLQGRPVAVVVSRSCMVVAGSEDQRGLIDMAAFAAAEHHQQPYPIAFEPVVLEADGWRSFRTRLEPLRRLSLQQQDWDCAVQAAPLRDWLATQGRHETVAAVEFAEDDGRAFSWCEWLEGETTLLPRAERVRLQPRAGPPVDLPWADFHAACGPLTPEPGLFPPRYRVQAWPTSAAPNA